MDELLRIQIKVLKDRLRGRATEMTGPSATMSDIAQEAVLRFLRVEQPPLFETPDQLRGYLWRAAWNLLLERLRRRGRCEVQIDEGAMQRLAPPMSVATDSSIAETKEIALSLRLTVQLLKPQDQEILDLAYFRQLGASGAASRLGISSDAAKTRLARAKRNLRVKLRGWSFLIG